MTKKTIIFLIAGALLLSGALALTYKDVVLKNLPLINTEKTQREIDNSLNGLDEIPDLNTDELTVSFGPTGSTKQAIGELSEIDKTLGNINLSSLSDNDFIDFGTIQ
jgi:hypothetical protein